MEKIFKELCTRLFKELKNDENKLNAKLGLDLFKISHIKLDLRCKY